MDPGKNIIKEISKNNNIKHKLISRLQGILQTNVKDDFDYVLNNTTDIEFYAYYHDKFKHTPMYKNFDSNKNKYQKQLYDSKYNFIKSIIDIKDKNILDIGEEDCHYSNLFKRQAANVTAVNVKLTMNYEGDKSCIKYYDGYNVPFEDNKFDIVLIQMVLHHVINHYDDLLKDVYRILKPGGSLIIEDHNFSNDNTNNLIDVYHFIFELIESKEFNTEYYNKYKVRRFTKDDLVLTLTNMGFKDYKFIDRKNDQLNRYYLVIKK